MFDIYKPKALEVVAEKLDCDVTLRRGEMNDFNIIFKDFYLQAGNYLIKTPEGKIYPANKDLFEYLFEKEENDGKQ